VIALPELPTYDNAIVFQQDTPQFVLDRVNAAITDSMHWLEQIRERYIQSLDRKLSMLNKLDIVGHKHQEFRPPDSLNLANFVGVFLLLVASGLGALVILCGEKVYSMAQFHSYEIT